ncbi:MAG: serine/threonine protein kinase [Phycisphaeraceae bacterium]|nr:MAG: serine/threonine protein kinase [Phycisphaeraceae bacterium]
MQVPGESDELPTSQTAPPGAPGASEAHDAAPPPSQIGKYVIEREIGRGGMGSVYLGVRDEGGFKRLVAIKVVRRGMDTEDIIRRFELERQLLAALNHPNIARFYEGGVTEDGRPYFVMEHIEGRPLDRYCESNRLSVNERLELFRNICLAVHHAHQNLVVHRDIKPGNILVTKEGVPKLVDFGIAKLLNPGLSARNPLPTMPDLRLLTPEYASPEQVRGEPITTASDVYSLGVVLYETLTGRRPYTLRARSLHEIERTVCDMVPERPSQMATRWPAKQPDAQVAQLEKSSSIVGREGGPHRLRKRLAGDIDNIIMMALRKEPHRRYASAEQLGEDIRRHLNNLPVLARSDSRWHHMSKFVKRNKLGIGAAAAIALLLFVGSGATAWQAHKAELARRDAEMERERAERRFEQVRELAHTFMFDFHDAIHPLAGSTQARELLASTALVYLDSLSRDAAGDADLRRELASGYERVGDVLGRMRTGNIGDLSRARESYEQALRLRTELARERPEDVGVRAGLSNIHMRMGDLLSQLGDSLGSLEHFRKALRIREELSDQSPGNSPLRRGVAVTLQSVGDALMRTGDYDGAEIHYERSVSIRQSLLDERPADLDVNQLRRDLSTAHLRLGHFMELAQCDEERALPHYRAALRLGLELLEASPQSAWAHRRVMRAHDYLARTLLSLGRHDEAERHVGEIMRIAAALHESDPASVQSIRDLLLARETTGLAALALGNAEEALEGFREQRGLAERMLDQDPLSAEARRRLRQADMRIGEALLALGRWEETADELREALRGFERLAESDPGDIEVKREIAGALRLLGNALASSGDRAGATAMYERSLETLRDMEITADDPCAVRNAIAELERLLAES